MASLIAIAMTIAIAQVPSTPPPTTLAPPGTPQTLYCLRVDPLIGSRIETVECKTRYEWAMLGLDVDQEWAENGVRVIGPVTG